MASLQRHEIDCDLLVAGGGMAGVCAAIAAARQGAKVVLVQDRSVLGGNASSEIRMHIVGADNHGSKKGWRESGLIEELRLEDAVRNPERCFPLWDVILYEKVVAEPHITLLLDTDLVDVQVEGADLSRVQRPKRTHRMYEFTGPRDVRIASARAVRQLTQDEFVIRAKFYADCTGDGRLGFEAGADFRIGRESKAMHGESFAVETDDVWTLGNSILITSRRTDTPVPFVPPPWARKFDPDQLKVGRRINTWEYGFWWIEWGGHLDTIKDNATVIRHELYKIALGLWDYVKNSGLYPDSANWTLDWIGAIPGKRESRRFIGEHVLTEQDILTPNVHADEVAYGGWTIDLHPPRGIDQIDQPPCMQHKFPHVYGIPLRCLYSRNVKNLFFAGRDISATHVAFASTRVMATCAVMGEAVGHAAAACLRDGLSPAQLARDATKLRALHQRMLREDVTLPNLDREVAANQLSAAKVTAGGTAAEASPANVLSGPTRDEVDPKTGELVKCHAWRSAPLAAGPQWIELTLQQPIDVSELHLTFDTGFQRELILSASNWATSHCVRGPQPETVRDYTIEVNGERLVQVTGNYQRKRVHKLPSPVTLRTLRLLVEASNGSPEARVFEVAAY